jgi:hypothetical protein
VAFTTFITKTKDTIDLNSSFSIFERECYVALRGVRGIAWHVKIFLGEKVRGILDLFYHVCA